MSDEIVELNAMDPRYKADPYSLYGALRASPPACRSTLNVRRLLAAPRLSNSLDNLDPALVAAGSWVLGGQGERRTPPADSPRPPRRRVHHADRRHALPQDFRILAARRLIGFTIFGRMSLEHAGPATAFNLSSIPTL
jgi:hypothetical protein